MLYDDRKKKEKSAEQIAEEVARKQRASLMYMLKPLLEKVANADDSAVAANEILAEKEQALLTLKKKTKQKAENELALLKEEFAKYL